MMSNFEMSEQNDLQIVNEVETMNRLKCGTEKYFECLLPDVAQFSLNQADWDKLRLLLKGHRFQRGEWEDYFVLGMKESNKYCVFAFKDHYVNQSCIRNRKAAMDCTKTVDQQTSDNDSNGFANSSMLKNKKLFSAHGYCVFEDCSIRFTLKMNAELVCHVFYTGQLKHSAHEVHARHFRGKSRNDLKEALKHTKPMHEYLNRVQSITNSGQIDGGNVDFVGKSTSVYRRIASEAKECYQALLLLRNQLIESTNRANMLYYTDTLVVKGYIQLIQHLPGSVVCYDKYQMNLMNHYLSNRVSQSNCLYISSSRAKSFVSTTINGEHLSFYEMCLKVNDQLIPLSSCLLNKPYSKFCLNQWLNMLVESSGTMTKSLLDPPSAIDHQLFIICENSMPLVESILSTFNRESFQSYANRVHSRLVNHDLSKKSLEKSASCFLDDLCIYLNQKSSEDSSNSKVNESTSSSSNLFLKVCSSRFMQELNKLCKLYYFSHQSQSASSLSASSKFSSSLSISSCIMTNNKFILCAFNVILNSRTLIDLQKSLYALTCILFSESINDLVTKSFDYLKQSFESNENSFKLYDINDNYLLNEQDFSDSDVNSSTNHYANRADGLNADSNVGLSVLDRSNSRRSQFLSSKLVNDQEDKHLKALNDKSPFYKMCLSILEKVKSDLKSQQDTTDPAAKSLPRNPRMSRSFLFHFINQFSATIPLWTNLVLDLQTINETNPLTLKLHHERFSLLNSLLAPHDEEKDTLDIFLKKLHDENRQQTEPVMKLIYEALRDRENECKSRSTYYEFKGEEKEILRDLLDDEKSKEQQATVEIIDDDCLDSSDVLQLMMAADSEQSKKSLKTDLIRSNPSNRVGVAVKFSKQSVKRKSEPNYSNSSFNFKLTKIQNDNQNSCDVNNNNNNYVNSNNENSLRSFESSSSEATYEDQEIIIERESQTISNEFGVELTKEDLESLGCNSCPTANLIEFYLRVLEHKNKREEESSRDDESTESKLKVLVYPIKFYLNLKNQQQQQASSNESRTAPALNMFDYNLIIIPIQKTLHWGLAAIDFRKQKITYYDPMHLNDYDCLKNLMDHLEKEYFQMTNSKYDFKNWKISNEKNIPKQVNLKDCGIFIMFYAKRLMLNLDLVSVTNVEIENFKTHLKKEIFEQIFFDVK